MSATAIMQTERGNKNMPEDVQYVNLRTNDDPIWGIHPWEMSLDHSLHCARTKINHEPKARGAGGLGEKWPELLYNYNL